MKGQQLLDRLTKDGYEVTVAGPLTYHIHDSHGHVAHFDVCDNDAAFRWGVVDGVDCRSWLEFALELQGKNR